MSDFFKSFEPVPYTVLRQQLRPLSLGAIIALHMIESPFIIGGTPTITNLMASVFVCTRPYREAIEGLKSPEFPKLIKKWAKKLGRFDFQSAVKLFAEYIKEGRQMPTYFFDASSTFKIEAPSEEVVLNFLLMHTTLTESEILDDPFERRIRNYLLIKAMRGEVQLEDDKAISEALAVAQQAAESIRIKEGA